MKKLAISLVVSVLLLVGCRGSVTPHDSDTAPSAASAHTTQATTHSTMAATTTAATTQTTAPTATPLRVTPTFMTGAGNSVSHYSVYLPSDWQGRFLCEHTEMDFTYYETFYEKDNHEIGHGGKLFTLIADSVGGDYSYLPNYEHIGDLVADGEVMWTLIVTYPTDVQFSAELAEQYNAMYAQIPAVLETVVAEDGYEFVKA